jgi:hypothetical protein
MILIHSSLKNLSLVLLLISTLYSCSDSPQTSDLQFDSAHTVAVDALIPKGVIQTRSTDEYSVKAEITEQLYYVIGQLNGIYGGADMADVVITDIKLPDPVPTEGEYFEATYVAKLAVAWPRERSVPLNYDFVIPKGGDYEWISKFFTEFDKRCIDPGAHDYDSSIFWYYYRPANCEMNLGSPESTAVQVASDLVTSDRNTEGKSPEYDKVWEDERLVYTSIFGKNESGETSPSDPGINAYNTMYRQLIRTYGRPDYTSVRLRRNAVPGAKNPIVHMQWRHNRGEIDVMIMLVDGIREVNEEFEKVYNERTKISDVVSYSGHSGLGANIRALARMGSFEKDHYQIYFVNGCDTYAYVDSALEDAHQAVNPDYPASKFFDIITNAMPSYFHANASANLSLLSALSEASKTYREILEDFDRSQRALVTGEEDNRWPKPFIEPVPG